ncbi:MAG TPA: hypothetical protein VMH83_11260 [Candidatus Acidoferrum sp.]|nr:hypothetical protein [Candidatus Acidoferrum sp.]
MSPVATPSASAADRNFFRTAVVILALLALAGFAPSYYLRPLFHSEVELTVLKHLHGAAFTSWTLLLVTQAFLISNGKLHWHRRLGYASMAVVVAMMTLTVALALERTQAWLDDPQFDAGDVLQFLLTPLATVVYFTGMYIAALCYRHRPAIHKRLLLIANLDLFTPAVSRLPWIGTTASLWHAAVIDILLLALVVHDWRTLKRVHPATWIGGILLIFCQIGREVLARTDAWMDIAARLVE